MKLFLTLLAVAQPLLLVFLMKAAIRNKERNPFQSADPTTDSTHTSPVWTPGISAGR
jgi:hypothetical protein